MSFRCISRVFHVTRGTPKLFDKEYSSYAQFTYIPDLHLKVDTTNTRTCLHPVHVSRETPKLLYKEYTLYTEFTHTQELLLKLGVTNIRSLHQVHVTREMHQW